MIEEIPMPKFVENKNDLKSLIQGDQVQIYMGQHYLFNPKHVKWAVYEGNTHGLYSFITRLNKDEIIWIGFEEANITLKEGIILPHFRSTCTYSSNTKNYSQLNKLLKRSGL